MISISSLVKAAKIAILTLSDVFFFDEPFEIFISDESIKERKIHTKKMLS